MKRKLLFRLLVIMLANSVWSCADSGFDLWENDMALKTEQELAMPHRLLGWGCTPQILSAFQDIYSHPMGRKMLDDIDLRRGQMQIFFYRTSSLPPNTMKYVGMYTIEYHPGVLMNERLDAGMFHEAFHIFQCGGVIRQNLNHEIEAYVAQCLYCGEDEFMTLDMEFSKAIKKLAGFLNLDTGEVRKDIDSKDFRDVYDKACERLIYTTVCGNIEWEEALPSYDFPNIRILMQK